MHLAVSRTNSLATNYTDYTKKTPRWLNQGRRQPTTAPHPHRAFGIREPHSPHRRESAARLQPRIQESKNSRNKRTRGFFPTPRAPCIPLDSSASLDSFDSWIPGFLDSGFLAPLAIPCRNGKKLPVGSTTPGRNCCKLFIQSKRGDTHECDIGPSGKRGKDPQGQISQPDCAAAS